MRASGFDAGIVNPYEYQRPVETREEFAGRHEILSKIEYALALAKAERPQYRNFAITGPRGIGKTSLVNVLVQMASEVHGLMAARTTLYNDTVEDHAKLFEDVLESILAEERIVQPSLWTKLTRAWRSTSVQVEVKLAIATLKAARQQGAQFPQKKLRDGLQEIYRRVLNAGTKAIVVCLDEADLLTKNETAVQSLRSIFEAQRGYILVLSGTDTLLDRLGATFGPIQRFFDHIELGPFDKPDEVYAALCNPLPPSEHSIVDMPFATEVFKMTAGHPFQVKLMAYHAYKEMRERNRSRMRLSPEIVDAVLEAAQTTGFPDLSERLDKRRNDPFESDEAAVTSADLQIEEALEAYESSLTDSPVVKLINQMLLDASNRGATDIEMVPQQKSTNVRMRVDGVLQPLTEFPSRLHSSLLARLKIIASLDIAERRLPQDGRAAFKLGEKRLEIVVRTLPSLEGESAFIHFRTTEVLELDALGLDDASLDALLAATSRRGVTILAGPNDSGRTTLAHALLLRRRGPNASLATIERSPATRLDGVTQYRANQRIGLSERALIEQLVQTNAELVYVENGMVEPETFALICQAAVSGTTFIVPTSERQDAIGALSLATALTQAPLVSRAISAAAELRLVRKLCRQCKGTGCAACSDSGYRGRALVINVITPGEKLRAALAERKPAPELRAIAAEDGFKTLEEVAMAKVEEGITSVEEIERVR